MTTKPDPLNSWVRGTADALPVPDGLEARILASAARIRRRRLITGAAALLFVGILIGVFLTPKGPSVEPFAGGPVIHLSPPAPPEAERREVHFTARMAPSQDGLVFRFRKGGLSDE